MNVPVIVICAILSLATVLLAVIPIIISKRRLRNAPRPVEYYPPRGFSPIDVLIEYYGFRADTHALLNPLMLYWAGCGYITIEEDCKRGLKLTKLRELEQANTVDKISRRDIKDADTESLMSANFLNEKSCSTAFSKAATFFTRSRQKARTRRSTRSLSARARPTRMP